MCGSERQRHLVQQPGRLLRLERSLSQALPEAPASEVPHHQVRTLRFPPEVIEGNYVGMLHPGHQLRLGLEPADELRIVREPRADGLDRHLPADLGFVGSMDGPKGSRPQLVEQAVPAERLADDAE